jgi:hypothetical protein
VVAADQQRSIGGSGSAPVQRWQKLGSGMAAAVASAAVVAEQCTASVHSATAAAGLQQRGC